MWNQLYKSLILCAGRRAPDGDKPAAAVGVRRGLVPEGPLAAGHRLLRPAGHRGDTAGRIQT